MDLTNVTLEIFSKLEQQWLLSQPNKKTRILTIDGGGTTAVPSGPALIHLEHQIQLKTGNSNSRIVDFFDIIAGTGIGAVVAAMINADDGTGRPLFSAKQAVKFVTDNRNELFKMIQVGIVNRKRMFSDKSIEKVLKQVFTRDINNNNSKVLTLVDTCKPMIVPCYDLNSSAPFVFSRADACESASFNFELWKVCRATSADPSMFKPFRLDSIDGKTVCLAVDGGLVMNNPSAAVVTHVLHNKRDFPSVTGVEDLLVLSIGNGNGNGQVNCASQRKVGRSGYCRSDYVVGVVRDGVSETIDQMLGNAFCWSNTDYVRIQANGYLNGGMGSATEEVLTERGVESLPFGGKRLLTETNGQRIENFVQRLVASGTSSLPPSPCKSAAVSQLVDGR